MRLEQTRQPQPVVDRVDDRQAPELLGDQVEFGDVHTLLLGCLVSAVAYRFLQHICLRTQGHVPTTDGGTPIEIDATTDTRRERIVEALGQLGFVLPGTITRRMARCGKRTCRCRSEPPQLHGPYIQWTRAVKGKTVTKTLSETQLAAYQPWFDDNRRLRELTSQLQDLSLDTIRHLEGWGAKS